MDRAISHIQYFDEQSQAPLQIITQTVMDGVTLVGDMIDLYLEFFPRPQDWKGFEVWRLHKGLLWPFNRLNLPSGNFSICIPLIRIISKRCISVSSQSHPFLIRFLSLHHPADTFAFLNIANNEDDSLSIYNSYRLVFIPILVYDPAGVRFRR